MMAFSHLLIWTFFFPSIESSQSGYALVMRWDLSLHAPPAQCAASACLFVRENSKLNNENWHRDLPDSITLPRSTRGDWQKQTHKTFVLRYT